MHTISNDGEMLIGNFVSPDHRKLQFIFVNWAGQDPFIKLRGVSETMEGIQLSETEQRYFGDLFICCDADNSGKVTANKATELFRTANLSSDSLKQVTWKPPIFAGTRNMENFCVVFRFWTWAE